MVWLIFLKYNFDTRNGIKASRNINTCTAVLWTFFFWLVANDNQLGEVNILRVCTNHNCIASTRNTSFWKIIPLDSLVNTCSRTASLEQNCVKLGRFAMDRKPHTNTLQASVQDARAATDSTIPAKILTSQIPKFWQRCQNQFWIFWALYFWIFKCPRESKNPKFQNYKYPNLVLASSREY